MPPPTPTPIASPVRRSWALVRWQLRVLRGSGAGRFALWTAGLTGLGFVVAVLGASGFTGPGAIDADLAVGAARLSAWCAAGPLLLSASQGQALAQRLQGREQLGYAVGASLRAQAAARTLALAASCAMLVLLPSLLTGLAVLGASASASAAWERARVIVALAPFALATGALLAPIAVLCDRLSPGRGRSLFLALVVLPFLLTDPAGYGHLSLPGLLEAVLDASLWLLGLGRFA